MMVNPVLFGILLAAALALVGVLGDFFIKLAGVGPGYIDYRWFFLGMVIYAMTAVGWFFAMKHLKLSTLGVVYAVTTVLALTLVAVFYFKESVSGYEALGIALGLASIVLLAKFA